jgi:NAD(P)-dependent dehydrogenase (short-subunit alcohol dehydrogenase family)
MRSVLITGTSTGIGQATAVVLASRGWRVFATMRNLAKRGLLEQALKEAGVHLPHPVAGGTQHRPWLTVRIGSEDILSTAIIVGGANPFVLRRLDGHSSALATACTTCSFIDPARCLLVRSSCCSNMGRSAHALASFTIVASDA